MMFKWVSKKLSIMLVVLLLATSILGSFTPMSVNAEGVFAEELFFSEYIEGSSNNKAIEIFNGTSQEVNLSLYTVELYANGAVTPNNTLTLSGTLASGEVYVIANSGAVAAIKDIADITSTVTYFNGDDALVLKKDGVIIDSLGQVGNDPGTYWGDADFNTLDHTLVRNSSVVAGDPIENDAFNPVDEWDCYAKDIFDNLGGHTMDGFEGGEPQPEKVSAVAADPEPGAVDAGTLVTMSTVTEGANILFKTVSTDDYAEYTAPIEINEDTTIWAIGRKEGFTDSDEAVFEYTIKEPVTETTIAEARGLGVGNEAMVRGVVNWVGDTTKVYIQDDTAAIVVDFYYLPDPKPSVKIGDEIRAAGQLVEYRGLLTLKLAAAGDVEVLSENNELPQPKLVTIPEVKSGEYEAQLVKLEGLTLGTIAAGGNTPVTDAENNTINIYRIVLPGEIEAGDKIDAIAIVSKYNTDYQLRIRAVEDVTEVLAPDTESPVIAHTPVTTGNTGIDLNIRATVTDDRSVSSVKLYYRTTGEATYKSIDMVLENDEYICNIPKAELSTAGLEYYIEASDGTNTITSPADTGAPYPVSISEADITGPEILNKRPAEGSYTGSDRRPAIGADYSDASGVDTASLKLYLDGQEVTAQSNITEQGAIYTPGADIQEGEHTVRLVVKDKSTAANETDVSWKFNVGERVYSLYFGQLHSHTTNSDGVGSLDDAYSYAREVAGIDFFAVTDHSNSLDNASTSSMGDGSKSAEWINGHNAADQYTNSEFVGIYAFEMTWSNGTGHMNTFNTPGFETRENAVYKAADGLKKYYDVLKNYPESISQFNHPGTTFGDFKDFAYYDPQIDGLISLIEVGNGEGAVGSSNYFPSYEYYTRALDKGWHVSPTNNQDNHKGKWGDANTARTVILADSLTRNGVYEAMRNMHTYATEDENLRIEYTLNGEIMGTILQQEPDSVNIRIDIEDPDNEALGEVSVISSGGKVVASKTLTTNADTVEFNLEPDYSYYYIRIDEEDGDIAVTAPVWIGEVEKAGISKTYGSTALPIKGEIFSITTDFYNNGDSQMSIESLEYSINGELIEMAPALEPVAALGTGSYTFEYTPDSAGKYDIDVKLVAEIGGVEKIFKDVLKLEVVDPEIVTKVVVDASHYNDYVNGYYSGNMTNLITLGNSEKINVILQKDSITDEVLENTQLLILSPPAKKAGTANGVSYNPAPYSEEEIQVIKRYADNGGNIIVTGLADYQDSRSDSTNHSALQQNRILEAIGAESRINDDEVVDYDNNPNVKPPGVAGGTPYRVPMNNYNMDSIYLQGVDSEQNYSFYSGCSITIGENAAWLVKGFGSTYGFDSDNDRLGGSYVADTRKTIPADTGIGKGNVVALATETLPGGGKLFVAGTVFYSNFEIKADIDNSTQLQNSNYNITMNILDSIKKSMPITPIYEVRAAQKGDTYCVEGTVTSGTVQDNAFFDTIYIQDHTGGINIFPVSGTDIYVGQKVKVVGTLDEYLGDIELRVIEFSVTDTAINPVEPALLTTKAAMEAENGGLLVQIEGNVTGMDSQNLYINDGSGEARAFVDGYIGDGSGDVSRQGKWDPMIMVGDSVMVIGLASVDTEGPRLRVRNTAEIVRIKDTTPPVITIGGVKDGGFYNTDVTPIVTVNEGIVTMTLNNTVYDGKAITQEGSYVLEVTAVDRDNNSQMETVLFMIDKTPPVITSSIKNGSSLERIGTVNIINTVIESGSGVAVMETTLDSKVIDNNSIVDLEALSFGVHRMIITAADKAGNTTTAEIDFVVTASTETLKNLVSKLNNEGAFKNKGIYNSLISQLSSGNMKAFINHVNAQSGKGMSVETANVLKEYAEWLSKR